MNIIIGRIFSKFRQNLFSADSEFEITTIYLYYSDLYLLIILLCLREDLRQTRDDDEI